MASAARSSGSKDERSDADLVAAAKRGEAAAVQALFVRHEAPVYRIALRMCRDPEEAKEVLQETLLAATRTLGEFRSEAAVSTWLYTIARSFCIKMRRRSHRMPAAFGDADEDEAVSVRDPARLPDEVAADHEVGAVVRPPGPRLRCTGALRAGWPQTRRPRLRSGAGRAASVLEILDLGYHVRSLGHLIQAFPVDGSRAGPGQDRPSTAPERRCGLRRSARAGSRRKPDRGQHPGDIQ
jgi:RNA polymerase sigma factor (sigma-70 family)